MPLCVNYSEALKRELEQEFSGAQDSTYPVI